MNPLHRVTDPQKARDLAASMERDGWQGAPLVKWSFYGDLLTGSHRYHAAHVILGWDDSEIPMIDIVDVFAEAGLDFDEVHEKWDYPYMTTQNFVYVIDELPADILNKYGLDIH